MHPWVSVYGEAQSKHLVIFSPREPPYGDPSKGLRVPESGLARMRGPLPLEEDEPLSKRLKATNGDSSSLHQPAPCD